MAAPRSFALLSSIRRRLARGTIADMGPKDLARARAPYLPVSGPVGVLTRPLLESVVGAPAAGVVTREVTVPGAEGDRPARLHVPQALAPSKPLVLHIHGGGWVVGAPIQYDHFCTTLAAKVGAVVVSVDYRMAPEHAAPAAAEDCIAVATWLATGGAETLGAGGPLLVGGDSAGGNLSALVAIALRDAGLDLAAQLLVYPAIDLTMSSPSANELTDEPILTRQDMDDFVGLYLAGGVSPDDPRVSPAFVDDLSGVAPALVITGERDPLRDEGNTYAARLRDAGVEVRHTEYLDMPHGFVSLPGLHPSARQAVAEVVEFARLHI